jgi:hypothetical protein
MKSILLKFDNSIPYGSKEDFWHFLLGYLLPAINFYIKRKEKNKEPYQLVFEDCGPLVNPLIKDFTQLLGISHTISTTAVSTNLEEYLVPRWDLQLKNSNTFHLKYFSFNSDMKLKRKALIKEMVKAVFNTPLRAEIRLMKDILSTKKKILKVINNNKVNRNEYLILDRSDTPEFYKNFGKIPIKGYGKSKRGLTHINETLDSLEDANAKVSVYYPGQQSIKHQIETFSKCKGLVAIRGAELANLIWLNKGTKVLMINPYNPAYHIYNLATILGLKLIERKATTERPNLQKYNVQKLLLAHENY